MIKKISKRDNISILKRVPETTLLVIPVLILTSAARVLSILQRHFLMKGPLISKLLEYAMAIMSTLFPNMLFCSKSLFLVNLESKNCLSGHQTTRTITIPYWNAQTDLQLILTASPSNLSPLKLNMDLTISSFAMPLQ